MESKSSPRFTLGRQSSLAPEQTPSVEDSDGSEAIHPGVRLMYMANEGDLDGIKELLDSVLMIEGCPQFPMMLENEVPKAYAANERPPFRAPTKRYSFGLRQLINECWSEEQFSRPTFKEIILRLDNK